MNFNWHLIICFDSETFAPFSLNHTFMLVNQFAHEDVPAVNQCFPQEALSLLCCGTVDYCFTFSRCITLQANFSYTFSVSDFLENHFEVHKTFSLYILQPRSIFLQQYKIAVRRQAEAKIPFLTSDYQFRPPQSAFPFSFPLSTRPHSQSSRLLNLSLLVQSQLPRYSHCRPPHQVD